MSTLTIEQVRGWRPEALDAAASSLGEASSTVDSQATSLARSIENALTDAGGLWAQAASERAADEARTGAQLADALEAARRALAAGAGDIGHARTRLLDTISAAEGEGFTVSPGGSVTAPTLPPVMTAPGDTAALEARNAQQDRLNDRAGALADDIGQALQAVADADGATADSLSGVKIPQTLESAVEAYIERATKTHDLLGALGTGAGAVALALALKKAVGVFGKSKAFLDFLKSYRAPITDYETFLKNIDAGDEAFRKFLYGADDGGFARFLVGARAAKLATRVAPALTVVTGTMDAVTGGGYDGARGWATRGFGAAGAVGGGALVASSMGLVALTPVGLGIAAAAVLGYGAWSLGNYVYDHWDDITEFAGNAVDWAGERFNDAVDFAGDATQWAGDRLDDASAWAGDRLDDAADFGKSAVDTLSFGLL